jgi:hypothetical protein
MKSVVALVGALAALAASSGMKFCGKNDDFHVDVLLLKLSIGNEAD